MTEPYTYTVELGPTGRRILADQVAERSQTGVSANLSVSTFNIDSERESERRTHTRVASTIFQIAVSCRLECSSRTLVESRFAAQTRCKSRCEVAAEATLHHVK
jgi:hypothetical protein